MKLYCCILLFVLDRYHKQLFMKLNIAVTFFSVKYFLIAVVIKFIIGDKLC